jgi:hypothetical protein
MPCSGWLEGRLEFGHDFLEHGIFAFNQGVQVIWHGSIW